MIVLRVLFATYVSLVLLSTALSVLVDIWRDVRRGV